MAKWRRGYVAAWLHNYVATWLLATWLHEMSGEDLKYEEDLSRGEDLKGGEDMSYRQKHLRMKEMQNKEVLLGGSC